MGGGNPGSLMLSSLNAESKLEHTAREREQFQSFYNLAILLWWETLKGYFKKSHICVRDLSKVQQLPKFHFICLSC